jgi:hypothetical protein
MEGEAPRASAVLYRPAFCRRGFGWLYRLERGLERRQLRWLNSTPFWLPRLRRAALAHHRARVDVILPAMEAGVAVKAMERRGWEHAAPSAGDDGAEDAGLITLTFTVPVRSGSSGSSGSLAQDLTVALADARVRGLHLYVIDPAHPGYASLPEWRATAPGSTAPGSDGRLEMAHPPLDRRTAQTRIFGDSEAIAGRALLGVTALSGLDVECVGTLTDRLHRGVVALREASDKDPGRVAVIAAALATVSAMFALTQVIGRRGRAPTVSDDYLWLHVPAVRWLMVACAALFVGAFLFTKAVGGRFGRRPQAVTAITGAMASGAFFGGYTRQDFTVGTVAGLAAFALIGLVWRWAGLARWRLVTVAVRLTTLVGVASGYGRWRMIQYYGGMGIPATDIDTSGIDAVVIAAKPLLAALVALAILLAVAWVVSGWYLQFAGVTLTILALATAASLLLGTLGADEIRGRRVGAGVARPSGGGIRVDPEPTATCLISFQGLAPDTLSISARLPRVVWKIGTVGSQTLLLDPDEARALHPGAPAASREQAIYVPARNVHAPIWYVPTSQLILRRTTADTPC